MNTHLKLVPEKHAWVTRLNMHGLHVLLSVDKLVEAPCTSLHE
jgi:hypothetical protein